MDGIMVGLIGQSSHGRHQASGGIPSHWIICFILSILLFAQSRLLSSE